MKKMIKWYGILTANNIEIKLSENPQHDGANDSSANKSHMTDTKQGAVKSAPPKKINSPRKMA